jgi:TetR/AcrR family transcriptional regulator, mexJK operon transcriptional repressor
LRVDLSSGICASSSGSARAAADIRPRRRAKPGGGAADDWENTAMNAPTEIEKPAEEHAPGRKETQILSAAREVFLEHGFSEASMEAIARAACVSKATVYAYFPSKDALFSHLIQRECEKKCIDIPKPDLDGGLVPALLILCRHFVGHFLTRDSAAFFQTVSSERCRFPTLCQLFFDSGKKAVLEFVADFLAEAQRRDLLVFEDAHIAAEQLLNLAVTDLPLRVALGLELRSEAEYDKIMRSGVAVFLKAYGASTASST